MFLLTMEKVRFARPISPHHHIDVLAEGLSQGAVLVALEPTDFNLGIGIDTDWKQRFEHA